MFSKLCTTEIIQQRDFTNQSEVAIRLVCSSVQYKRNLFVEAFLSDSGLVDQQQYIVSPQLGMWEEL